MPTPKTYLNVPYAQKDAAKVLGARWDAAAKKWFVPAGKDIALFAQWQIAAESVSAAVISKTITKQSPVKNTSKTTGTFTHPTIADFVPYSGNAPPWD